MCVCVCVCVCVQSSMCVCVCLCVQSSITQFGVCVQSSVCVCVHAHWCLCVGACVHVCLCVDHKGVSDPTCVKNLAQCMLTSSYLWHGDDEDSLACWDFLLRVPSL